MHPFEKEAKAFGAGKAQEADHARQLVAASLVCGIDLSDALEAPCEQRACLIRRIERVIERERLKGMRRHWSYDLNRHIALKQALDRLREAADGSQTFSAHTRKRKTSGAGKANGARRRRQIVELSQA